MEVHTGLFQYAFLTINSTRCTRRKCKMLSINSSVISCFLGKLLSKLKQFSDSQILFYFVSYSCIYYYPYQNWLLFLILLFLGLDNIWRQWGAQIHAFIRFWILIQESIHMSHYMQTHYTYLHLYTHRIKLLARRYISFLSTFSGQKHVFSHFFNQNSSYAVIVGWNSCFYWPLELQIDENTPTSGEFVVYNFFFSVSQLRYCNISKIRTSLALLTWKFHLLL